MISNDSVERSRNLMEAFLQRTGVTGDDGDPERRYLWTDALAVQCCFALAHSIDMDDYRAYALKLIGMVHHILGRHREDDPREGWISGLSEEEGERHPTAGGLRIGKKLPERKPDQPINKSMEWERDGQYFHYLTRWFHALMQAHKETGGKKYAVWAADLIKAGEKFIEKKAGRIRMYWKMSIDLLSPAVESMGAHDPLEGLICAYSILEVLPERSKELKSLKSDFETLCRGMDWLTDDPLGTGGLLLNTARAAELEKGGTSLPDSISTRKLLEASLGGLQIYKNQVYHPFRAAEGRLAFRECGLSLGTRVLHGSRDRFVELKLARLEDYLPLAKELEEFWLNRGNQKSYTWQDHLDINAVTLASSLSAQSYPTAFA